MRKGGPALRFGSGTRSAMPTIGAYGGHGGRGAVKLKDSDRNARVGSLGPCVTSVAGPHGGA
jgi:hypothetical protein